jgi:hypothetical protein
MLAGCQAYGALTDTITAPIIEGQMAAEKKRQAKGTAHATSPASPAPTTPRQ